MKKKILLTIALVAIFASLVDYFYHTLPHQFEIRQAAWLKIFNGTTGESLEVTDPEVIQRITENINAIEFKRLDTEKIEGHAFTLTWYDKNNGVIESLYILDSGSVIKNGRRYQSNGRVICELDLDYIESLFSNDTIN